MQLELDLGRAGIIVAARDTLRKAFPIADKAIRLDPIQQLVKSLISSRTKDSVSWPVSWRLVGLYRDWASMADAETEVLASQISDVTFAADKACYLSETLQTIRTARPDFDLSYLAHVPLEQALHELCKLPGVGIKVAASVLNFSTLDRPALVVDTHVLRLLRRLGLVPANAPAARAFGVVMGLVPDWDAAGLVELHILLKRLGQTFCTALDPHCVECPLRGMCPQGLVAGTTYH
jgi:endonuclease-3